MLRVRFAPSPTGYLHIGGARTALFNWLWARKNGGTLILRIEDTDQARSTEESSQAIIDSLNWLGMDWDEGPFIQSQRLDIYKSYADDLVAKGLAYRCYATVEELEAARKALHEQDPKAQFKYPGWWRDRTDWPANKDYVIRFKVPESGSVTYQDKVFGKIVVPNSAQQDFILIRSDGLPLYNFAAVVDDMLMGITLVARGRDHMINTPAQILLYQALGAPVPEFAHLPLMLAPTGEKLAKRNGTVSVGEFRKQGIAPGALLNYLARFGWAYRDQEVFSLPDLIDKFDWKNCNRADGKFDTKKLAAINFAHLKDPSLVSDAQYCQMMAEQFTLQGQEVPGRLAETVPMVRNKLRSLPEAVPYLSGLFHPETLELEIPDYLPDLISILTPVEKWDTLTLKSVVTDFVVSKSLKLGEVAQLVRKLLIGREVGPELFQTMEFVGKEQSLKRLARN